MSTSKILSPSSEVADAAQPAVEVLALLRSAGPAVTLALALAASFYLLWLKRNVGDAAGRGQKHEVKAFTLQRILVHPIKSCRGSEVASSGYTSRGLDFDRHWVIVDASTHKTVTAREQPSLVRVLPIIDDQSNVLKVTFPDSTRFAAFDVVLRPTQEQLASWEIVRDVKIWSDTTDGYIVPSTSSISPHAVLSDYLGLPVLLILKGPTPRVVSPHTSPLYPLRMPLPSTAETGFADGFPFLVVSEWSIDEASLSIASEEVKPPLSDEEKKMWKEGGGELMRRTRGNLVVGGPHGQAWEEDSWGRIRIGQSELLMASLCGRCLLPNVDPSSGVKHPSVPFKVLTKTRRVDPTQKYTPCFGVNAVPRFERGVLSVGDVVEILAKNDWFQGSE